MGIEIITLLIIASLFFLMAVGVPLGASTLLVSLTAALLKFGAPGLILVSSNVVHVFEKYDDFRGNANYGPLEDCSNRKNIEIELSVLSSIDFDKLLLTLR